MDIGRGGEGWGRDAQGERGDKLGLLDDFRCEGGERREKDMENEGEKGGDSIHEV